MSPPWDWMATRHPATGSASTSSSSDSSVSDGVLHHTETSAAYTACAALAPRAATRTEDMATVRLSSSPHPLAAASHMRKPELVVMRSSSGGWRMNSSVALRNAADDEA